MTAENHERDCMRYLDGEMSETERVRFESHLAVCESCRKLRLEFTRLKEATEAMKLADLPEIVWESYWSKVYNRIERSVAWFLFIVGAIIVNGYWLFKVVTNPELRNALGLGLSFMLAGFAVLFLSVLREKAAVNKSDRYIREVKR